MSGQPWCVLRYRLVGTGVIGAMFLAIFSFLMLRFDFLKRV